MHACRRRHELRYLRGGISGGINGGGWSGLGMILYKYIYILYECVYVCRYTVTVGGKNSLLCVGPRSKKFSWTLNPRQSCHRRHRRRRRRFHKVEIEFSLWPPFMSAPPSPSRRPPRRTLLFYTEIRLTRLLLFIKK